MPNVTAPERTEPIQLPRKKRSAFWWVAGLLTLLLALFLYQLFGPDPQIIVSPRITYVTEPMRANGLPDYERFVLQLYRDGVTAENNAATLLWQALWPGELGSNEYAIVAAELGLAEIPSKDDALTHLHGEANVHAVRAWLNQQGHVPLLETHLDPAVADSGPAEKLLDQATKRPWTGAQIPPLAQWIADNEKPLELIVEASHRTHCYFPSPSLLDSTDNSLVMMLLPGQQSSRAAAVALAPRAMWHLGENRPQEAWNDVLAIHRLARLVAQGHCLVEQLIALHISNMACHATVTLLHHAEREPELARQIHCDLAALSPDISSFADSITGMERVSYLDLITRISKSELVGTPSGVGMHDKLISYGGVVSVDWNLVLLRGNEFYDRLAAAARMPTGAVRDAALTKIDNELNFARAQISVRSVAAGLLSRKERSEIVAKVMLAMYLPALRAVSQSEDREREVFQLTKLAAGLAVYRAEHAEYPAKLEQLVPAVIETLPVDRYNRTPFIYKRSADGYLLYSLGENGSDDGGSNEMLRVLNGQPLNELDEFEAEKLQSKIPAGADDISIRVPQPALDLPKMPASAGTP